MIERRLYTNIVAVVDPVSREYRRTAFVNDLDANRVVAIGYDDANGCIEHKLHVRGFPLPESNHG